MQQMLGDVNLGFVGPNMEILLSGLHQANKKKAPGFDGAHPQGERSPGRQAVLLVAITAVTNPQSCDAAAFETDMVPTRGSSVQRPSSAETRGLGCFGMLGNPSKVGNPGHFLDAKLPHLKDQQRLPRALPRILHRPGLSLFFFPGGKQKCLGGQLPNMSIARFGMGQKWVCTQAQAGLNQQKDVGVQPIKTTLESLEDGKIHNPLTQKSLGPLL